MFVCFENMHGVSVIHVYSDVLYQMQDFLIRLAAGNLFTK